MGFFAGVFEWELMVLLVGMEKGAADASVVVDKMRRALSFIFGRKGS